MKVWGLLRVKNEARWIKRVIESLKPICDEVLVFDDHSTDDTGNLAWSVGALVRYSSFETLHEARDKDFLLAWAWNAGAQEGDYCLMIDGDELLNREDIPALQAAIASGVECASFHIVYLWDREDQVRVDRWYREFRRPSLFKLTHRNLAFRVSLTAGSLHCSSAPAESLQYQRPIPVRLMHLGYLYREDRVRKYYWYNRIDPGNQLEDEYRHMVIGDLFPVDSVFKHAGPLELQSI